MPGVDINFLNLLRADFKQFPVFIETGTLAGITTFAMEPIFERVYTFELKEEYYNNVSQQYKGDKIEFVLGDSSKKFLEVLPTISRPAIFFLDGHWSSGDTGRGDKDCPLYEELSAINTLYVNEAIIIIDDMRLCGRGPSNGNTEDWMNINVEDLKNVVAERTTDAYSLPSDLDATDRLVIHIRKL